MAFLKEEVDKAAWVQMPRSRNYGRTDRAAANRRMKKAFIFDMDDVLVNSEKVWVEDEADFLKRLVGGANTKENW